MSSESLIKASALPAALSRALVEVARQPPPKGGVRALMADVRGARALPLNGAPTLGMARCLLALGDYDDGAMWGEIATDRLGKGGRYLDALEAQVIVARASIALGNYPRGRGALRGVSAALVHLYPDGAPGGPEAIPFQRLRGRFALGTGELRLVQGDCAAGERLFAAAMEDLAGTPESIACQVGLGVCHLMSDLLDDALEAFRAAFRLAQSLGADEEELEVILALAPTLIVAGSAPEGAELGQRGEALAQALGRSDALVACRALSAEASGELEQVFSAIEVAAEAGASWAYAHLVLVAAHLAEATRGPKARAEILLGGVVGLLTQGRHGLAEMLRGPLLRMEGEGVDLGRLLDELEGELGGGEG